MRASSFARYSRCSSISIFGNMDSAQTGSFPTVEQSSPLSRRTIGFVMARILIVIWLMSGWPLLHAADVPPFGIGHRIPWTTSRVIGSPEPALPYTVGKSPLNSVEIGRAHV